MHAYFTYIHSHTSAHIYKLICAGPTPGANARLLMTRHRRVLTQSCAAYVLVRSWKALNNEVAELGPLLTLIGDMTGSNVLSPTGYQHL